MKRVILRNLILLCLSNSVYASELTHQFNSPSFNGMGYSSHTLTIYQLETQRTQKLKDEKQSAIDKAERDAKSTNIAKFLVNIESRIYAQLSKQLADQMFAEGGGNNGTIDFQGTTISWVKTGSDVTLTILETNGNRTEITVPISGFSF